MKIRLFISVFIGIFVLMNCQRKLMSDPDPSHTMEETAKSVFEKDYNLVENGTGDFALISKEWKSKPSDVYTGISFIVYDQSKMSIVYRKMLDRGTVKWLNDDELVFESIPGRSETPQLRYIYNVRTNQVSSSNE